MKSLEELKVELLNVIPLGLDMAFSSLKAVIPNNVPKYADVIQFESRYLDIQRELLNGNIESEKATVELNKLRSAVILFVKELKAEDFVKELAEQAQRKARMGKILKRIPNKMQVNKEERCVIRLAVNETLLLEGLEIETDDAIRDVRMGGVMSVEMIDPGEQPAFAIRTMSTPTQTIFEDDFTEWLFFVKPLTEGTHPLMVKVAIVEIVNGIERKREIVLEEIVEVLATATDKKADAGFTDTGLELQVANAKTKAKGGKARGVLGPLGLSKAAELLLMVGVGIAVLLMLYFGSQGSLFSGGGGKKVSKEPLKWEEVDPTDSLQIIRFLEESPESPFASEAEETLESLRLQFRYEQRGDSLIFYATGGILPKEFVLLQEDVPVFIQKMTDRSDLVVLPKAYNLPFGEYEATITDQKGTRSAITVVFKEPEEAPVAPAAEPAQEPVTDNRVPRPTPPRPSPRPNANNNNTNTNSNNNASPTEPNNTNPPSNVTPPPAQPTPTPPAQPLVEEFRSMASPPVYRGCRNRNQNRLRECTESNIRSFILRELEQMPEIQDKKVGSRLDIVFIIDEQGKVSTSGLSPEYSPAFAAKVKKAVESLPQFTPGKNALGDPVKVRYGLPVRFEVR